MTLDSTLDEKPGHRLAGLFVSARQLAERAGRGRLAQGLEAEELVGQDLEGAGEIGEPGGWMLSVS